MANPLIFSFYVSFMKQSIISINNFFILLGIVATSISFWLGSRFTADDAFITWRFGKNLVETGLWNYNPSTLDLTQAYTNPIYALLSVIPSFFEIDVVLFFKITSTLILIAFIIWFLRSTRNSIIMLLMLLCIPATMIHIYGGLETFLFVFLISVLLVSLDRDEKRLSTAIALILFITRPESWILVLLVPLFFAVKLPNYEIKINLKFIFFYFKNIKIDFKIFTIYFSILVSFLFIYFLFHYLYFGNALPNTFYAKSNAAFAPRELVKFIFFISPIFLLLLLNKYKILIFTLLFFLPISFSYSKSHLLMDYASRFAFHIFIPIYCYLVYVAATKTHSIFKINIDTKSVLQCTVNHFIKVVLVMYMLFFALTSGIRAIGLFTSYPRLLSAHGELGKLLSTISSKYNLDSFLIGDAGIAAYHSKLNILDSVGLGSSQVSRKGITPNLMDKYDLDLVAFYATPDSIQWSLFSQPTIYKWTEKNNFIYLCDLYWREDYTLKIYSKQDVPEINELCNHSKLTNNKSESDYFKDMVLISPFKFWHQ